MSSRPVNRRRAFTLIEVAVGLALGVVLLLAVQGVITGAYRTANVLEARAAERARCQLPFQILGDDLHNLPAGGGLELSNGVLALRTLNALQSNRAAVRHAVDVRYSLQPLERGQNCWLRAERELGQPEAADAGVVIAKPVTTVEVAVHDGQQWHSRWPLEMPRPVRAVRLRVMWAAGGTDEQIIQMAPLAWRRHDE
jgi:prepilin-type N-terminal cleavage/methylation domain-containing protein